MRRVVTALATVAAIAFSSSAFAQGVTLTPNTSVGSPPGEYASFTTSDPFPYGSGYISADFEHNGIPDTSGSAGGALLTDGTFSPSGTWVDTYLFTILDNGIGSGSVTTETAVLNSPTDVDILSVLVNGVSADHTVNTDYTDQWSANDVPISYGVQNSIQIVYSLLSPNAPGNGGYTGHATFTPAAVPEPATWAMMLVGFGAAGYSLRRKRKVALAQLA